MSKQPIIRGVLALFLLITLSAASRVEGQDLPALTIEGVEEAAIYFEPVTPSVVVPEGFRIETQTLNGEPYDGEPIESQGLFTLQVTAVPEEGVAPADEEPLQEDLQTEGDGGRAMVAEVRFLVLDPKQPGPEYTVDIVRYHVQQMAPSPHVGPTASADSQLVLGMSHGWPDDPEIPPHELFGFQIAAPDVDQCKLQVILVSGNHPREQTGNWALHGALDFLVSDDPRAEQLREWATFFVYPMVNPDGRYIVSGRSNPEMLAENVSDHNRVWNTSGRFSTIDVFVPAMREDTGGTADYLLDFHSAGDTFFFTSPDLMRSPYSLAMTAREPEVGPRRSEGQPGMLRIWSMTEEGLNVRFGYTPELGGRVSAPRSLEIGRSYMLVFHDLISGTAALAAAAEVLEEERPMEFGSELRDRIPDLQHQVEEILAVENATVHDTLDVVYALYDGIAEYRHMVQLADEASSLIARARDLQDQATLPVATPIVAVLAEEAVELETALQDRATEAERIRSLIGTLEGLLGRVGEAEQAGTVLALAAEALEPELDGFGGLFQEAIGSRREALAELLGDPGADLESQRQATADLEASVAELWQIGSEGPFAPVHPQPLEALPAAVELRTADDWQNGLLVDLTTEQEALVPVDRPVLRFDGDGAHVATDFQPGEAALGQQFTWEFWKQYHAFANHTGSSGNTGDEPRFYSQLTSSDGDLRAAIGDSYWTATQLEEPNRWYHIAIVFEEGEVRTYVDGDLRDTRGNVVFEGESPSPFAIGRGFRGERWLDGATREHRIWKTVRKPGELRRDRHRPLDGSEPGLVAYWPLDEGQGDTVHDRSSAENHGTVLGAQWQRRGLPGYRLSQPLALPDDLPLGELSVCWETVAEDDPQAAVVTVWAGFSSDPGRLPDQWRQLDPEEPLEIDAADRPAPGSLVWFRQALSPAEADQPVGLQRLTLTLGPPPAETDRLPPGDVTDSGT